ncbi:UNVERIFIED_CONTAM: hypothetical protein PYX00_005753 [Menopon gallinae]|uniref:GDT1 family protein n=1 Tax=Menopon gallinae TaxID=328185 RepID=A0AAW2HUI7_9NEOP
MAALFLSVKQFFFKLSFCMYFIFWGIMSVESENVKDEDSIMDATKGNIESGTEAPPVNTGFFHGFVASFSVIIVSELGDKTFFIAAIMAMRHPRLTVFVGAISALALMTILSVGFGWLTTYIPRIYTYYISTALFAIFGLKMLRDGYYMSPNEGKEELEEVQSDLRKREDEYEKNTILTEDLETGGTRKPRSRFSALNIISRTFLQAFSLTFLAEWGDRSQLTTIILAARENIYGVTIGGVVGHSICTGLAVIGGRMIAQRISVRTGRLKRVIHPDLKHHTVPLR